MPISFFIKTKSKRLSEKGSALVYILVAIALLAALTASFMKPASQQTTAQSAFAAITDLKSQIEFVRSAIQECVLTYPSGDRSTPGLIGTSNTPYPINPSSTYFTTPAANDQARFIRCPGNPGNTKDHADVFSGMSGKFLQPPPKLFEEWEYYNGIDGVFFYTSTDKTDAFLQTATQKLDDLFSECESDIIDASAAQIELTSTATAGDPKCSNGSLCFRLWVITKASATYNGDTDGEELAAGCP